MCAVHRLETTFVEDDLKGKNYAVKVAVAGQDSRTKFKPHDETVDQTLQFSVKDAQQDEPVTIEVYLEGRKKALVTAKLGLPDFFKGFTERKMTFTFGAKGAPNTVLLFFSGEWRGDAPAQTQAKPAPPVATLSTTPVQRPWFTRVSYYYDTSKNVYNYTTSFRVVAPFARFYEGAANLVLEKVTGKTLADVDTSLVVPVLSTVDTTVDSTISTVVTKLFEGQQYVLKKKDDAVATTSSLARAGSSRISSAASTTYSGAVQAKDYTATKVSNASSAVVGTVSSVADYTKTQVVNVSSSTYGTVRDTSLYVLSYVPILGPKIRA